MIGEEICKPDPGVIRGELARLRSYHNGSRGHHMKTNEPSEGSAQSGADDLAELFARRREQLRRMVYLRLDRRLQARVDASDVLQDAFLEAIARYREYRSKPA